VLHEGNTTLAEGIELWIVNGHTEYQQLPYIYVSNELRLLYAADLFPTYGHIPLPYVMGYDIRPLITLEERAKILEYITENDVCLFYEHDPYNETGKVIKIDDGKYKTGETAPLTAWT
jgi:glyoxylase-like metal-dependent hydrolase (beta-lactamase superfamily II)